MASRQLFQLYTHILSPFRSSPEHAKSVQNYGMLDAELDELGDHQFSHAYFRGPSQECSDSTFANPFRSLFRQVRRDETR